MRIYLVSICRESDDAIPCDIESAWLDKEKAEAHFSELSKTMSADLIEHSGVIEMETKD